MPDEQSSKTKTTTSGKSFRNFFHRENLSKTKQDRRGLLDRFKPKSTDVSRRSSPSPHGTALGLDSNGVSQLSLSTSSTQRTDVTQVNYIATQSLATKSEDPGSDWKTSAREGLGVASRFTQTLLKRVPDCVDGNPVKMAFSIAKLIIDIKDGVGDNQDKLVQRLEGTAMILQSVERTLVIGVPKVVQKSMTAFSQCVVTVSTSIFPSERASIRILGEEMRRLTDLSSKHLALKVLDHEEDGRLIQQIFQRVEGATTSFQVDMAINIQTTASKIQDDIKKAALERLRPSQKADHKTFLEELTLKRETCTPGTRVGILEDITAWAKDSSPGSPCVFWLTGHAGSGKTTIAYTIAKSFDPDGNADHQTTLGGTFLCSRQFAETRERTRIIPTIAYQLAHGCEPYAEAVHVHDKFGAVNHDVSIQLKDLFMGPWSQSEGARRDLGSPTYLIVIDALDEIQGNGGSEFLRELLVAIDKYDPRGLKFLVTSRSDPEVLSLYESFASKAIRWLQHVPIEEVHSDIETYLKAKLPKLTKSGMLADLARRGDGLFIYAATAVKYLTPHPSITTGEQTEMLQGLLSNKPADDNETTSLIDELYRHIMRNTFSGYRGPILKRRLHILYTILCAAERISTSVIAALLQDGDDEATTAVVKDLHAVLYFQDGRVFWYHASFPDFILNSSRSNFRLGEDAFDFSCDESAHHSILGKSCFHLMESGLRFNMGDIPSSFLFDSDDDSLAERLHSNITSALRYSCQHWTHHLHLPQPTDVESLCHSISDFLQLRVLFWIEAMNLIGLSNICTPMLQRAQAWIIKLGANYSTLARDVGEAANFATHFRGSPAAQSTPHLYISALATWLQDTPLSRKWKTQFSRIPAITHTKGSQIGVPLMTIKARSITWSVAFSSDGTRIVGGLDDCSLRVWDASTGTELSKLTGHTAPLQCIALSNDGMLIVSCSGDHSVRIWDASTGAQLKELKGHRDWVSSVAFSSDATRIVSGSEDTTARIWDVSTGAELHELKGHRHWVTSVAFSSNGKWIVSASRDECIGLWDASTGLMLSELDGHTDWVSSVAFSNDDKLIASGSGDQTVRVWDASTGEQLHQLDHTSTVDSVAFSSVGTRIVSGSEDTCLRVWDVVTGKMLHKLSGHTESVLSVAFSSNGTRIVSGSWDESVRVWDWDTSTGAEVKDPDGHTDLVESVAFSSDGTRIISGSRDRSVRVWNASTGAELLLLKGHTGKVQSVAYSNDESRIVSSSEDATVRVWDASTGAQLNKLVGHTSWVESVAFSGDDKRIVSGSRDQSVRVWDALTGSELNELKGHTERVASVVFTKDDRQILSGSGDKTVRVWDASTGAELHTLTGHVNGVESVAVSSNGAMVASGSWDYTVQVWAAATYTKLYTLRGHTDLVTSVRFSSDCTRLISSSWDQSLRMWDSSTGATLTGHTDWVASTAFSNDGTRIVSGSGDHSVRVWDVSTALEVQRLKDQTDSPSSSTPSTDPTPNPVSLDKSPVLPSVQNQYDIWTLGQANWIVYPVGQRRLMWVPRELQVKPPSNIMVISRAGFGTVHFTQSMIGDAWVGCYTPS